MQTTIQGQFVISYETLRSAESSDTLEDAPSLETMLIKALRVPEGSIVEVNVTVKTTTKPPFKPCTLLGYYSDQPCGALVAPSSQCTKDHYHRPIWSTSYHRPAWSTSGDPDSPPVCTVCAALNVEPSREPGAQDYYNRKGLAPSPQP